MPRYTVIDGSEIVVEYGYLPSLAQVLSFIVEPRVKGDVVYNLARNMCKVILRIHLEQLSINARGLGLECIDLTNPPVHISAGRAGDPSSLLISQREAGYLDLLLIQKALDMINEAWNELAALTAMLLEKEAKRK